LRVFADERKDLLDEWETNLVDSEENDYFSIVKELNRSYIIHIFALLHAATCVICSLLSLPDALILTLLTMAMVVIICLKERLSIEFTSITIILANIIGFALGNLGAAGLDLVMQDSAARHAIATFLTTEIMGWGLVLIIRWINPTRVEKDNIWKDNVGWLVAAVTIVFMLRVAIDLLLSSAQITTGTSVRTIAEVAVFCMLFLIYFALHMRNQTELQREKTHQAEYRYAALKQQVNPHFLFNSLNILDSLVLDGEKEDASKYIHSLSSMYRYMLQHEGEKYVRLSDEILFARMYTDLLKVRFPEGFSVHFDIPDKDNGRFIVPCTLQLLVENATKHNAIGGEKPLEVSISSDGESLTVSNNRIPKLSPATSTGIGLTYVQKLYSDAGGDVKIEDTPEYYRVKLPLL